MTTEQLQKRNDRIRKMYYSTVNKDGTRKYSQRKLAAKVGLSKTRIGEIVLGQ